VRNFYQQFTGSLRRLLAGCLCLAGCLARAAAPAFPAEDLELFEKRIRPLLAERCYECHSSDGKKLKGGLHLDSRAGVLKGGDTRPAVIPGQPDKSLLLEAVGYGNQDLQMPPKSRLSAAEVAALTEWVKRGAPWPAEATAARATTKGFDLQQRKQQHWSWTPPRAEPPPAVKNPAWSAQPVDRFLLAKLEAKQLAPAPAADPRAVLRRLHFDLTGLPPSPEDVERFERELSLSHSPSFSPAPARAGEQVRKRESEKAFERVVDSLLASPHFGERWARHWLDLVRYAETRGHEFEPPIPNAYHYRDYVVRAFNADLPYRDFVIEHLAGDLLPKPRLNPATGGNESILGTGFWFLGEEVHSPVDIRQDECDRLDNRLDVMSKTFLGMTVACARCHDHKFDAISQRDYYALAGFLVSSTYRQVPFAALEQHRDIAGKLAKLHAEAQPKLLAAVATALAPGVGKLAENLLASPRSATWSNALAQSKASATHPLHAFAIATDGNADAQHFATRLTKLRDSSRPAAALPPASVVVDFARPGAKDWVQDGWAFGLRPALPGEILFGDSEQQPLAGLATRAAAVRDPAFKKLAAKGVERDVGTLGEWERSGQTLRTPDVTLTTGSLWYLARGPVRAYAAVDSHLIVKGPLHGELLREFKDDPNQWRWVEHPLAAYRGHRVHVEFSPVGPAPLAIAMVVQSEGKPAVPEQPESSLATVLTAEINSPAALAAALQRELLAVVAEMKSGQMRPASAPLADWLVQNLDLLCPPDRTERQQLAAAVKPLLARHAELAARIQPVTAVAPAILDGPGADELLLVRGQPRNPAGATPRRFLEALSGTEPPKFATGSGRLELAQQIVDPANPFTARVIVNRVWHHLFGRGLVPSVDNLGVLGQPPTHRELLDYLAVRFVRDLNWSVKALIRELVLTRAYQMSSAPADARAEQLDPDNELLHRAHLRRLEGEAIRDSLLAVSGRLDRQVGGPSVMVHLTPFMDGRGKPSSGPLDGNGRRSLYISVRRNFLPPMMLAFDLPIPFTTMGRRNVSNVPAQALILMNDPFVVSQSRAWAKALTSIADPAERVRRMYLAAFSRPPSESELNDALAFVSTQGRGPGNSPTDERVWADLGHVLFNVKEFIYLN
jgi:cytochrome c553